MSLVRNEQAKLTATYLNNLAVALFAVGGLAPFLSALYGVQGAMHPTLVGSGVCMTGSFALHLMARGHLRRLKE